MALTTIGFIERRIHREPGGETRDFTRICATFKADWRSAPGDQRELGRPQRRAVINERTIRSPNTGEIDRTPSELNARRINKIDNLLSPTGGVAGHVGGGLSRSRPLSV